jgi:hypothetical protein
MQEPNKVALRNKRHFEERKTEIMQHVQNIQYGYLLNKYLKCSVWRLAVRYDIYIYIHSYDIRRQRVKDISRHLSVTRVPSPESTKCQF